MLSHTNNPLNCESYTMININIIMLCNMRSQLKRHVCYSGIYSRTNIIVFVLCATKTISRVLVLAGTYMLMVQS